MNIHENIYQKLNYFYEQQKIPHIIFHGSSGCGKRTIVDNFLKKIYQNDNKKMKTNVMFVNCAHGKGGIKFIREDLKFFAKTNIHSNSGVLFKTIILLNADKLTIDAQSALRRCIELFSSNTRFFIIVENKHKLLNPILSRFCEIYVPEYIDNCKVINLHQLNQRRIQCSPVDLHSAQSITDKDIHLHNKMNEQRIWITDKIEKLFININTKNIKDNNENIHLKLVELAVEFYENGLSCLDFINWIEDTDKISGKNKSELLMNFDKIKPEYRCEKLLLLYLFDSLKNILKNNG
jgi:DNA polymerase III delta prime subunit